MLAAGSVPGHAARSESHADTPHSFTLRAEALRAGGQEGVVSDSSGAALVLAEPGLRSDRQGPYSRFGMTESAPYPLPGLFGVSALQMEADTPEGTAVAAEARGYLDGRWTEWRAADALDDLGGVTALQMRVWLYADREEASPRVRGVAGTIAPTVRAAQLPARRVPTVRLWATREGLVGSTTANGHVIAENDRFVALPSKRALNRRGATDYMVMVRYRGQTAVAPVWDVGPWNLRDDYWNQTREQFPEIPRWVPQAEEAFFNDHNRGRDGQGRFVTVPASIDLADGTFWEDLGMTMSDWVEVSFLWVDAASPSLRPTPVVTAKSPPPGSAPWAGAASYSGIKPSPRLHLPLVMHEAWGWTTTWTLQNPSPVPVSGLVAVHATGGNPIGQTIFSLPPFGSETFSPQSIPDLPPRFVGSAVISASGPVAGVVNGDRPRADRWTYEAVGEASPTLVLPLVFKDYRGWSTGLQLQNVGGQPTTAHIQYIGEGGSAEEPVVLAPMATHALYPPGGGALPSGFAGAALVQSIGGQPLVVLANSVSFAGGAMAYPALSGGSVQLHAPLLFSKYHGWSSGLRVFNLSSLASSVLVAYKGGSLGSTGATGTATVPGSGAVTLYQPTEGQLPEGFVGSASVLAGAGSPLVGVVSKVRSGARVAMTYAMDKAPAGLLAVPLAVKGDEGWDTGIQVQNAGPAPSGVLLALYDESGGLVHRVESIVEAWSSQTYYLPAMPEVPTGFRGSAIVQALSPAQGVVVVVSQTAD